MDEYTWLYTLYIQINASHTQNRNMRKLLHGLASRRSRFEANPLADLCGYLIGTTLYRTASHKCVHNLHKRRE